MLKKMIVMTSNQENLADPVERADQGDFLAVPSSISNIHFTDS